MWYADIELLLQDNVDDNIANYAWARQMLNAPLMCVFA